MRFRALSLAALLAALGAPACGGEHDATEKQLSDLRAEMVKLRADQAALGERFETLELARGGFRGAPAPSSSPPGPAPGGQGTPGEVDRPDLDVVRLAPGADPDDPDADTPRPVVRVTGSGGSIQERAASRTRGTGSAQEELDKALDLYKAKAYDRALEALAGFLVKYPDHPGAESATFYRGECYLARGEPRRAVEQFEAVVSGYPQGARAADALLRSAQAYTKLGDKAAADQARKKLLATYPTSDAAKKLAKTASDKKKP